MHAGFEREEQLEQFAWPGVEGLASFFNGSAEDFEVCAGALVVEVGDGEALGVGLVVGELGGPVGEQRGHEGAGFGGGAGVHGKHDCGGWVFGVGVDLG